MLGELGERLEVVQVQREEELFVEEDRWLGDDMDLCYTVITSRIPLRLIMTLYNFMTTILFRLHYHFQRV